MARYEGPPPEDGRNWIDMKEAVRLLDRALSGVLRMARKYGWTMYQKRKGRKVWLVREEVASWAEFERLRTRWRARHRACAGERLTEKVDPAWAEEVFISSREAAARLGVPLNRIYQMVARGRLTSWQGKPGHGGSRLWLSPTQIERLLEEPEWLARQARGRRAYGWRRLREPSAEGGSVSSLAAVVLLRCEGEERAAELLTPLQAAAVLGITRHQVHSLMRRGRLRGVRIWRGNKMLRYWYFYRVEVEELRGLEDYQMFRERVRRVYVGGR